MSVRQPLGAPDFRVRRLRWAVAAACALVVAVAAGFVELERRSVENAALERVELYAKVLDDQIARTMDAASGAMSLVAENISGGPAFENSAGVRRLLTEQLVRLPFVRSFSVVDSEGRVRASSAPGDVGVEVPIAALGRLPERGASVGAGVAARDLADLAAGPAAREAVTALTMLQRLPAPDGATLYLVALINTEYFATQQERILDDPALRSAVFSFDARLLGAGTAVRRQPGERLASLPVFSEFLPEREHGQYVGDGVDGEPVVTAFRAARSWPLVTVVEQPLAALHAEWMKSVRAGAAGALAVLGVIALVWVATERNMRRELAAVARADALADAVARSEELWKFALEGAGDGVFYRDLASEELHLTPRAQAILGYSDREIGALRQDWWALVEPGDAARAQAEIAEHLAGRTPSFQCEVRVRRKDGGWGWILMRGKSVGGGSPGSGRVVGTISDIGERKADEKALRANEARTQAILQSSLDAIVTIDADSRVLEFNAAAEKMFGWSSAVAIGRPIDELMIPERYRQAHRDGVTKHRRTGVGPILNKRIEIEALRSDGTVFPVELTVVPVRAGEQTLYTATLRDITERLRAQRELETAREREFEIGSRIQQSLLVQPPDANLSGVWLSAYSQASLGIDGDFFDVMTFGERFVDVVVGDVMGKGIGAALMGAATKMQFSRCVAQLMIDAKGDRGLPEPADIVSAVHRAMTPNLLSLEAFVTVCYLRIDTVAGTLTWVGCGHEEPLLVRAGGDARTLANQHPPIGVLDEQHYTEETVAFDVGDGLFLCSDGITDALRTDGTRVGRDGVAAAVEKRLRSVAAPAAVLHGVRAGLRAEDVRFTDDVTMLLAVRTPANGAVARQELATTLASVPAVRDLVESRARLAGLDEGGASLFAVACVEAFTNIVRHARGRLEGAPTEVFFERLTDRVQVDLVYLGDAYEPPSDPPGVRLDAYPEGGFGLSIMREAADRVEYLHRGGVNTVRLTKSAAARP